MNISHQEANYINKLFVVKNAVETKQKKNQQDAEITEDLLYISAVKEPLERMASESGETNME